MHTTNKLRITQFMEAVWNHNQMEQLSLFLHPGFTDHSLPPHLPANKDGLRQWIEETGRSFEHRTEIEAMVSEADKVMIKIKMTLVHIGAWRGIEATGTTVQVVGYRYFQFADDKITAHWGLIDGNAIEQQLKQHAQGCKVQQ